MPEGLSVLDISAKELLKNHYYEVLRDIAIRLDGMSDNGKVNIEEKGYLHKELTMIIEELERIVEEHTKEMEEDIDEKGMIRLLRRFNRLLDRYFHGEKAEVDNPVAVPSQEKQMPMASSGFIDSEIEELLKHYGEKVVSALSDYKHLLVDVDVSKNSLVVKAPTKISGQVFFKPILKVTVNDSYNVNRIIPLNHLEQAQPWYGCDFYQNVWKPVVEAIGHFFVDDFDVLISTSESQLPEVPVRAKNSKIKCWNRGKKAQDFVDLSFCGDKGDMIWVFRPCRMKTFAKYAEQDYMFKVVECVDPILQTVFGKVGEVEQIYPRAGFVEIDVDFGDDLGIIRLTNKQVKVVGSY